jgi:hypothetical protein
METVLTTAACLLLFLAPFVLLIRLISLEQKKDRSYGDETPDYGRDVGATDGL